MIKKAKIFLILNFITKVSLMIYILWCIGSAINILLAFIEIMAKSESNPISESTNGFDIVLIFIVVPCIFISIWRYFSHHQISINDIVATFLSVIGGAIIFISIFICADHWPNSLFILFSILLSYALQLEFDPHLPPKGVIAPTAVAKVMDEMELPDNTDENMR